MSDAPFALAIEESPETVQAGETVAITVTVENTGEEGEEVTIDLLDFDGEQVASEDVSVEADESETLELEWTPGGDAVGSGVLTVRADDVSVDVDLTVEDAPATFSLDITSSPEFVTGGSPVRIEFTVENTGTLDSTQDVEITVDDEVRRTDTLTVAGGATESCEYGFETDEGETGDVSISVSSADDSATETVNVVTPTVSIGHPISDKSGMGLFGWLVFIGMAILLIPLLPIILVLKLLEYLVGTTQPTR